MKSLFFATAVLTLTSLYSCNGGKTPPTTEATDSAATTGTAIDSNRTSETIEAADTLRSDMELTPAEKKQMESEPVPEA